MKKYILILLIFCFGFTQSPHERVLNSQNRCSDCSGTTTFIWECNSTTVGSGRPCGCSDGDTTATLVGNGTITSGAAVFDDTVSADGNDYYAFDNGADVLSDDTLGTIFIRFKVTTSAANNIILFWLVGDADNKIIVRLLSGVNLEGIHEGNTDDDRVVHTGNNVSTGTEYIARYRWRTGEAGNDNRLTLYSTSMAEIEDDVDDDDLTAFATQAGDGDFIVGQYSANASNNISIYYIHVYNEWLGADPNA